MAQDSEVAFPQLTEAELALVQSLVKTCDYADGEIIFRVGQADIDLVIVESGEIEIRNPTDGNRVIVIHGPGQFSGDIDLLTGRPVIVTAVARGANSRAARFRTSTSAGAAQSRAELRREADGRVHASAGAADADGHAGIAGRRSGPLPRYEHGARVSLQELCAVHVVRPGNRGGTDGVQGAGLAAEDAGDRMRRRASADESDVAGAGARGRHLETLPFGGGRLRDCRRGAGGDCRGRVRVVGRTCRR